MDDSVTVIESEGRGFDLGELYAYRDLFVVLAWKDLRVRYAQTALGLTWALLQPALTLAVFTLVFGQTIGVSTGRVPYPVFALAGMVAWTYFAFVVSNAAGSIIAAQNVVQKSYFPRLVIPLSKAMVGLMDLLITAGLYLAVAVWYGIVPGARIGYLPLFVLGTMAASLGAGIALSALSVRYRDVQHVVPFFIQIGLYATPVGYPASMVPDRYSLLYHLNPMAGMVEGFRWSLCGGPAPPAAAAVSFAVAVLLFVGSLIYFRRVEALMADLI
jgi:lipopolysaccharide transport system permease protein